MPLPVIPLPASSVEVNGTPVTFRSLSRAEALHLHTFKDDPDAAEVYILARGCDVSDEDARAFRDGTTTDEAGKLIDGILVFSGLAKADDQGEAPDPKSATNGRSWTEASVLTTSS